MSTDRKLTYVIVRINIVIYEMLKPVSMHIESDQNDVEINIPKLTMFFLHQNFKFACVAAFAPKQVFTVEDTPWACDTTVIDGAALPLPDLWLLHFWSSRKALKNTSPQYRHFTPFDRDGSDKRRNVTKEGLLRINRNERRLAKN